MTEERLSEFNRQNLAILASYLESGKLQAEFFMAIYSDKAHNTKADLTCGTVGCAVGHGPYAGIEKNPKEFWGEYSERCFCAWGGLVWCYLFAPGWAVVEPTAADAAARIRRVLAGYQPTAHDLPGAVVRWTPVATR